MSLEELVECRQCIQSMAKMETKELAIADGLNRSTNLVEVVTIIDFESIRRHFLQSFQTEQVG